MYVQDVMSYNVGACGPEATLADAARIMWDRDCGAVPIIDGEKRVVGMVTDRDICMALSTQNRLASEVKVGEVMSQSLRTCTPVDDIREAMELMRHDQLRRLPVVDGQGRLAGILSVSDIVRHADKGKSKKHVSHRDAMALLKAITKPHEDRQVGELVVDDADAV